MGAYQGKRFTCDNTGFKPITAPIDCNAVILINDTGVKVMRRTSQADASTQTTLDVGDSVQIGTTAHVAHSDSWVRFGAGSVVCYVEAADGTGAGDIYAEFVR